MSCFIAWKILGFCKTRERHAHVIIITNISWLSESHHGRDRHGFQPCSKQLVLRDVEKQVVGVSWGGGGGGDNTLFYLASSDWIPSKWLRGGRDVWGYGEGHCKRRNVSISFAQSHAVTQSTIVRRKVKLKERTVDIGSWGAEFDCLTAILNRCCSLSQWLGQFKPG